MVIGTEGFVGWFYAVTWRLIQRFCKKTYGKFITHSLGVILIILGMYPIIRFLNPIFQFGGLALIFGGLVLFITPFSLNQ